MTTLAHYVADDLPSTGSEWPQRVGSKPADLTYWTNSFRESSELLLKKNTPRRMTRCVESSGVGGQALITIGPLDGTDENLFPAEGNTRTYEAILKNVSFVPSSVNAIAELFSGYIGANSDVMFSFERGSGSNSEKYRLNVRIHDATNKLASYTSAYSTFATANFHYLAISVRIVSGAIRLTAFVDETLIANDVTASPAVGFSFPTFPGGSTSYFAATENSLNVVTPPTQLLELRVTDELITQALATERSRQLRIVNARKA